MLGAPISDHLFRDGHALLLGALSAFAEVRGQPLRHVNHRVGRALYTHSTAIIECKSTVALLLVAFNEEDNRDHDACLTSMHIACTDWLSDEWALEAIERDCIDTEKRDFLYTVRSRCEFKFPDIENNRFARAACKASPPALRSPQTLGNRFPAYLINDVVAVLSHPALQAALLAT